METKLLKALSLNSRRVFESFSNFDPESCALAIATVRHLLETDSKSREANHELWQALVSFREDAGLAHLFLTFMHRQGEREWRGQIQSLPIEAIRSDLDALDGYQLWSLVPILCDESRSAASREPRRAMALGALATACASRLVPIPRIVDKRVCQQFLGSALAVQANAVRAADRVDEARTLFARAQDYFDTGGDSAGLRASFYSLRASMEIDEAEYGKALRTVDTALASATRPEERARLFLKRSAVWIYSNETVRALQEVERAVALLDDSCAPRLRCCAQQHQVELLSRVGRLEEAQALLPEVRRAIDTLDSDLDSTRLDWVEARTAAGLGRVEEGEALYRQVRAAFLEHGLPYKAAIATVELARHLFRQGRFPEVAALAMESAAEFRRQGVEPEVLGALALLEEATSGHLTLKAIEQLLKRIEHAAHGK